MKIKTVFFLLIASIIYPSPFVWAEQVHEYRALIGHVTVPVSVSFSGTMADNICTQAAAPKEWHDAKVTSVKYGPFSCRKDADGTTVVRVGSEMIWVKADTNFPEKIPQSVGILGDENANKKEHRYSNTTYQLGFKDEACRILIEGPLFSSAVKETFMSEGGTRIMSEGLFHLSSDNAYAQRLSIFDYENLVTGPDYLQYNCQIPATNITVTEPLPVN